MDELTIPAQDRRSEAIVDVHHLRLVLTVEEAARCLGIGRSLMYELVMSGEVESVMIGRLRRIPVPALTAYVEALRARGSANRGQV